MEERKKDLEGLLEDLGVLEESLPQPHPGLGRTPKEKGPKEALEGFLVGLLLHLDPQHSVEVREEGEVLKAEVFGGDLGRFIGKEGKTLKAVEYLARAVLAKRFGNVYRVELDAAGYKRRREERLKRLAHEAALQVEKSQFPLHLPPMPPGERRVIHMLLKDHPKVTTGSQGEGEERRVVVYPRELPEASREKA